MILKKFIIKDQKELYRHKSYLLSLELEFNSVKKEYSNSSELDFNIEHELIEFLNNNEFTFSVVEEKIVDFRKQTLAKFKTLPIDSSNLFIVEKKSNSKIFLINQTKNKIQILDLKNEIFKSYKASKDILDQNSLALRTLALLASNQDDFKELFSIYAILENQSSEDLFLIDKLKKFKYFCMSKIKGLQKDMFLCNCVPGFFPETNFYIKGDRVFSSYTEYFLNYEQEFRVWKYLYANKNLVGVFKEPTLEEMFVGRKIFIIDEFKNRTKALIKYARYSQNGTIFISLSNGVSTQKLSQEFTKDELLKRVLEARD